MKKQKQTNLNFSVGYCRYSSDNQGKSSSEAQMEEIQKYAKVNDITIREWYIDEAQSGTNADRKNFLRMIEDSKKRNFNQILVYQLDRFARNEEDKVCYTVDLRRNGVKSYFYY